MTLLDGTSHNYGAIEERDGNILYYTGKGLREVFRPITAEEIAAQPALQELVDRKAWDELKASGHVHEVPLSSVVGVE